MHYLRLTPTLLAVLALACPAQTIAPRAISRDEVRPDEQLTVDLFGKPVRLGGSWEFTGERRSNFDLDSTSARDRRVRGHEVQLEALMRIDPQTEAFAEIKGLHDTRRTQGDAKETSRALERGQFWLKRDRLGGTPWSLQLGRVALEERRSWWWDDDLDAVRAVYAGSAWQLQTGLAREVAKKSSAERSIAPESRGVTRWFGQATWPWAQRHALDAFWLLQRDGSSRPAPGSVFANDDATDPSDLRARWLGLRASGEWRVDKGPRLAYWADTAWLSGRERLTAFDEQDDGSVNAAQTTGSRVRGNAFDIGATGSLALPLRPSLTIGYARGSSGYRLTGRPAHKARFAGVKRWLRYGELLQPELSNLSVATVGTGVRVLENSSIELVAHRYRQVRAADALRNARPSADPQGSQRAVGREINLLLAVRESKRVEFLLKAARFKPGAAFAPGERDAARAVEVVVTVNF